MPINPGQTHIFHITDVTNLPQILAGGQILSDARIQQQAAVPTVIGMPHIKLRRMTELRIACCGFRFVGEFVPFYYCPRSPMLYTINRGNTGRPVGCQASILHLVSDVERAVGLGHTWAISDGNAGARHASFFNQLEALEQLDWNTIRSNDWSGRVHTKHSEFLVADSFPWAGITHIGCLNGVVAGQVAAILAPYQHQPQIIVRPDWYY